MQQTTEQPNLVTIMASSIHDIKNSVCILIDGLERMLQNPDLQGMQEHGDVSHMVYETKRINSNLIQMLTLYKVGCHLYPFDPLPQTVGEFVVAITAQNAHLLASRGITFEIDCDEDTCWQFDEDLVNGVVCHALNNAINYTKDRIRLVAKKNGEQFEIRVEDNGQGYPERMIQEGTDAMKGVDFQGGSTGLGLYFSAVVAKMHRHRGIAGEIILENGGAYGGGCFVLRLP